MGLARKLSRKAHPPLKGRGFPATYFVKAFMRRFDEKNPVYEELTRVIQLRWARRDWEMMSQYDRRSKVKELIRDYELSQSDD